MLVFVDTEFTSLDESAELLSIGLVGEADESTQIYLEVAGASLDGVDKFIVENVVPKLHGHAFSKPFEQVALEVWHWLEKVSSAGPTQIACDWTGDWAWTMLLLDVARQHGAPSSLPPNVIGPPHLIWETICSEQAMCFSERWRHEHNHLEHHALHDAANNRATYLRFRRLPDASIGEPHA
jgi:hypothetical protein